MLPANLPIFDANIYHNLITILWCGHIYLWLCISIIRSVVCANTVYVAYVGICLLLYAESSTYTFPVWCSVCVVLILLKLEHQHNYMAWFMSWNVYSCLHQGYALYVCVCVYQNHRFIWLYVHVITNKSTHLLNSSIFGTKCPGQSSLESFYFMSLCNLFTFWPWHWSALLRNMCFTWRCMHGDVCLNGGSRAQC